MSEWYYDETAWRRECTTLCDYFETSDTAPHAVASTPPAATPKPTPRPHSHSYMGTVVSPTCTSQGYTTYWCPCGSHFVGSYVDALGHAWSDYVSDGSGNHTRTCGNDSSHYQQAQCDDGADADELCDACGYDLHVHSYDSYAYDSSNHWKVCSCGDALAAEAHHWYLYKEDANKHYWRCDCGNDGWGNNHFDNNDTGKCDDCGYEMHTHSYSTEYNDTHHWQEYSCGDKVGEAEHTGSYSCDNCEYHKHLFGTSWTFRRRRTADIA